MIAPRNCSSSAPAPAASSRCRRRIPPDASTPSSGRAPVLRNRRPAFAAYDPVDCKPVRASLPDGLTGRWRLALPVPRRTPWTPPIAPRCPTTGPCTPQPAVTDQDRTIRHELDRDLSSGRSRYSPRPPVPHKLAPYTGIIAARLEEFPELSTKRLFDEVRAAGYPGGYSRVRDYVRSVRPRRAATSRRCSFQLPEVCSFRLPLTHLERVDTPRQTPCPQKPRPNAGLLGGESRIWRADAHPDGVDWRSKGADFWTSSTTTRVARSATLSAGRKKGAACSRMPRLRIPRNGPFGGSTARRPHRPGASPR